MFDGHQINYKCILLNTQANKQMEKYAGLYIMSNFLDNESSWWVMVVQLKDKQNAYPSKNAIAGMKMYHIWQETLNQNMIVPCFIYSTSGAFMAHVKLHKWVSYTTGREYRRE